MRQQTFTSRARASAVLGSIALGAVLPLAGCGSAARKPAKEATAGAVEGLKDTSKDRKLSSVTRDATEGVLQALAEIFEDPGKRDRLRNVIALLAEDAGHAATRYGPDAEAAARGASRAVVEGLLDRREEMSQFLRGLASGMGEALTRSSIETAASELEPDVHGKTDTRGQRTRLPDLGLSLAGIRAAAARISEGAAAGAVDGIESRLVGLALLVGGGFLAGVVASLLVRRSRAARPAPSDRGMDSRRGDRAPERSSRL